MSSQAADTHIEVAGRRWGVAHLPYGNQSKSYKGEKKRKREKGQRSKWPGKMDMYR